MYLRPLTHQLEVVPSVIVLRCYCSKNWIDISVENDSQLPLIIRTSMMDIQGKQRSLPLSIFIDPSQAVFPILLGLAEEVCFVNDPSGSPEI